MDAWLGMMYVKKKVRMDQEMRKERNEKEKKEICFDQQK
jgi:hypothetical protein